MQNPSDTVIEGSTLALICKPTGGNPEGVVSYSWSFSPRYVANSELRSSTDRELEFDNVQHTQAGVYRCEADNGAGVGSDSKEVLVKCKVVKLTF